jgi:Metallo-peptidase family M12B Reprolysin-like
MQLRQSMTTVRVAVAVLAISLLFSVPSSAAPVGGDLPAASAKKKGKKKKKKKKPVAPVVIPPGDADGDALPNAWETAPAASKQPVKKKKKKKKKGKKKAAAAAAAAPELWKLGASPNHKDVFVQLNFDAESTRDGISCGELDSLVNAFATAPVTNPDGTQGINLHLDAGKVCPSRSYALGSSPVFAIPGNPPCPNIGEMMNFGTTETYFTAARVGSFRLAVVGDGCGQTHGVATQPGITSAVFTNQNGDLPHVFMHELGHNLGLGHEFSDSMGGIQPNRLSVMSNQLHLGDSSSGPFTQIPDYQRFAVPALDESSMLETTGLQTAAAHRYLVFWKCPAGTTTNPGPGPAQLESSWPGDADVDWNCTSPPIIVPPNGPDIQSTPVTADVNADGDTTDVYPALTPEWSALDYSAGGAIGKLTP